jgi:L-malate glycosyltransferase
MTAERWRRHLSKMGIVVQVMETEHLDPSDFIDRLDHFHPHILHAHHISRAGVLMLHPRVADKYGTLPLVVSPAGTDINLCAMRGAGREQVGKVCAMARCIISQSAATTRLLQELLPDLKEGIAYVPKAFFWLGKDRLDLRTVAGCREGDILFFMPAGIRPVKGNLECLAAMEKAHEVNPQIRVVFAGPAIDADYSARFAEMINRRGSFAAWILRIPPEAMGSAYESVDVVLNHSASEGLSNSLLEAMAAGRPVLASDIPGNRWLISDEEGAGPCGCLFNPSDRGDFIRQALRLANDAAFRASLAAGGRLRAAAWPDPSEEAHALADLYEAAVSGKGRLKTSSAPLHLYSR